MENKEVGYDIENCCSSEIRNDGFTNVSTIDDCLKIISQMCVQITDLKHENKLLSKALELAVADKCKFENEWLSMIVGMPNGKLLVPKKEQWYLEQAQKEMRDGNTKS